LERRGSATDAYNKNRKPQTHKRRQKKRVAIPVSTPKIPMGFEPNSGMGAAALMYQKLKNEINSSLEKGKKQEIKLYFLFFFSFLLLIKLIK
jgi:hypothetical protein